MAEELKGFAEDGQVHLGDPTTGQRFTLPVAQAQTAVDRGAVLLSKEQVMEDRFDAPVSTFTREALNAVTFGGVNAALRGTGIQSQEEIEATRQFNPASSAVGTATGLIGSLFIPGGAIGAAGKGAATAGRVARAGGAVVKGAAEGARLGAQAELAQLSGEDVALGDAASRIAKSVAVGAAIGGPLSIVTGGALPAVGRLSDKGAKLIARAEERVAQTVGSVFQNFGPLGNVVGKAASSVVKGKLLGGALPRALNAASKLGSPAGIAAARAGILAPAVTALSGPLENAKQQLRTDYLAAASDGFTSGAIGPESTPDSTLEVLASGRGAGRPAKPLSDDSIRAVIESAQGQDPATHADAAREAYLASGSTPEAADQFAQFQARRIQLLSKLSTDDPLELQNAKRVTDAVFDPGSALDRIGRNEGTPQDLTVLRTLYPVAAQQMSAMADIALDSKLEQKLTSRDREALQRVAGGKHRAKLDALVATINQTFAARQQQAGPSPRAGALNLPNQPTNIGRLQASG